MAQGADRSDTLQGRRNGMSRSAVSWADNFRGPGGPPTPPEGREQIRVRNQLAIWRAAMTWCVGHFFVPSYLTPTILANMPTTRI